jgi:hypothetical protein
MASSSDRRRSDGISGRSFQFPVYLIYLCVMSEEAAKWILGLRRYLSRKWINNLTVHMEGLGAGIPEPD